MIGYVAKDKDKEVYLHLEEPSYDYELEGWYSSSEIINITRQFPEFNAISYTDDPIKVEINIKRI